MKNAVQEYLSYSDEEKQELWDHATFVFDTNVFLNLYRYSAKTRELLLSALDKFKDRVWMPHHVACEFMKNRSNIIWETNHQYDNLNSEANKFIDNCRTALKLDKDDKDLNLLKKQMVDWIEQAKRKNVAVIKPDSDIILEKLLSLFDNKVGDALSEEESKQISEEGKKRYAAQIPPGYKDSEKQKGENANNTYGDLIVWKQILKYASSEKKDIILVTNDQKEDWWEILHGQTLGARVELRREFIKETSQKFYMYSMSAFISRFESGSNPQAVSEAVDEIEFFSKVLRHKSSKKELRDYYSSLGSREEETAARIRYNIMRLENKNRKRLINIEYNSGGYAGTEMPADIETMVRNNIANYEKDVRRIDELKRRLAEFENS